MKKGKSRNKRKKTRSRLLWIAIAVMGIAAVISTVCDMVICDDAVITHELTVRFAEDGSFQYLGNEILNDGIQDIPNYQYRIRKE